MIQLSSQPSVTLQTRTKEAQPTNEWCPALWESKEVLAIRYERTEWCPALWKSKEVPAIRYECTEPDHKETTKHPRKHIEVPEASNMYTGFSGKDSLGYPFVPPDGLFSLCLEGPINVALKAVTKMSQEGTASIDIFALLLSRCTHEKDLKAGREVHELIMTNGLGSDAFLGSHLIQMFLSLEGLGEAFQVFNRVAEHQAPTLVAILKACSKRGTLEKGRWIHSHIIGIGLFSNSYVHCTLIDMYINCQSLPDAHAVFATLPECTVEAWNALITGYIEYGCNQEGLNLFQQMQQEGMKPSRVTFVCVLKACSRTSNLEQGRKIHASLVETGLEFGVFVGNSLIDMYVKCRCLGDGCALFDRLSTTDVVSCNALLAGYAQQGHLHQVLQFFSQMAELNVEPDPITFVSVLKACCSFAYIEEGRQVHAFLVENGYELNKQVGNMLVHMYSCCNSLKDACSLFSKLPQRNVVSWSALIAGHVENNRSQEALSLFFQMQQEGVKPNQVALICVLTACSAVSALQDGRMVHRDVVEYGHEFDIVVGNALIHMYAKCGSLEDASMTLHRLPRSDVITWTALIEGYAQYGHDKEAFLLFEKMQRKGPYPNAVTFISILRMCTQRRDLHYGRSIHSSIIKLGLEGYTHIGSTLINMYAKCGHLETAERLFNRLPQQVVTTWNTLIDAYAHHGKCVEALQVYQQMQSEASLEPDSVTYACIFKACTDISASEHGRLIYAHIVESGFFCDVFVCNTLIHLYARCGSLRDAYYVFYHSPIQSIVIWNTLLTGFVNNECSREALELFWQMQGAGIQSDTVTFLCTLKACSSILALEQGKLIHALIIEQGLDSNQSVANTLVHMYSSCGDFTDAHGTFDSLHERDIVTWSALIGGYARNSDYYGSLKCYEGMQQAGLVPDAVTHASLLCACSHRGLLEEGCRHYKSLRIDYGLLPTVEHANPVVDLLGKAGCLDEAEDLLETTPFRCNLVGWASLLYSCKRHTGLDIGRRCFDLIVAADHENAASYVIMSDIYTRAGKPRDAASVEDLRKSSNAWKKPAKALIEADQQSHEFRVGDTVHTKSSDIYTKMKILGAQMRSAGYTSQAALFESTVCRHSEQLAIAFGLISTSPGATIRVAKNVRMCSDCHVVTKIISKIEIRDIVVKDAYCLHHFKNGLCSCTE